MPLHTPPRAPVSGSTRLVGLLGGDIRHSLSLELHNTAFAAQGLDWLYVPLSVPGGDPRRLAEAMTGLRALGFVGANVTMPHKQSVIEYLDHVTDQAQRVGAVNTIKVTEGGQLVGGNTDTQGFLDDLDAHAVDWKNRPALILGAGGAARAVAHGLASGGCPAITLVNRTHRRAVRLADDLEHDYPQLNIGVERWLDGVPSAITERSLVVNCTSVGMMGTAAVHAMPWPENLAFHRNQAVADVVYTPTATPLLLKARSGGVNQTVNGVGMLVRQAALSFSWWTDQEPPIAQMFSAATGALEASC